MTRSFQRALVLGGAGFLGRALAGAWQAEGTHVTTVGRRSRFQPDYRLLDVLTGDLGTLLSETRPDVVVHLASSAYVPPSLEDPYGDLASNAGTTARLFDAVRRMPTPWPLVIVVSSAAVYGDGIEFPMGEDHPCRPVSPYGVSKLAAEEYAAYFHRAYGVATFSVRPFSLYGPGQKKLVVYDLARRMLASPEPITIAAAPEVTRDFVYVSDAAAITMQLARRAPAEGERYNVCSGRSTPLREIADHLARLTDRPQPEFTGTVRAGDPIEWRGDPRRAAALEAGATVGLADGLTETVAWIRAGAD